MVQLMLMLEKVYSAVKSKEDVPTDDLAINYSATKSCFVFVCTLRNPYYLLIAPQVYACRYTCIKLSYQFNLPETYF